MNITNDIYLQSPSGDRVDHITDRSILITKLQLNTKREEEEKHFQCNSTRGVRNVLQKGHPLTQFLHKWSLNTSYFSNDHLISNLGLPLCLHRNWSILYSLHFCPSAEITPFTRRQPPIDGSHNRSIINLVTNIWCCSDLHRHDSPFQFNYHSSSVQLMWPTATWFIYLSPGAFTLLTISCVALRYVLYVHTPRPPGVSSLLNVPLIIVIKHSVNYKYCVQCILLQPQ